MKNLCFLLLLLFPTFIFGQDTSFALSKKQLNSDSSKHPLSAKDTIRKIIRRDTTVLKSAIALDTIKRATVKKDSAAITNPANKIKIMPIKTWQQDTLFTHLFYDPILKKPLQPVLQIANYHQQPDKELLFYILAGLIVFLAYIKTSFSKYFKILFSQFTQRSQRKKQLSENFQQNNLPALFLNLLFFITTGLLVSLLASIYLQADYPFWLLVIYCISVTAFVYSGKYLIIRLSGWIFNNNEAASAYTSLVFFLNKIFGLLLVPLLMVFAFGGNEVYQVLKTILFCIIIILLSYRYFASLSILQHSVKMNVLHFFIYFCSIELIPVLAFYKLISKIISGSF